MTSRRFIHGEPPRPFPWRQRPDTGFDARHHVGQGQAQESGAGQSRAPAMFQHVGCLRRLRLFVPGRGRGADDRDADLHRRQELARVRSQHDRRRGAASAHSHNLVGSCLTAQRLFGCRAARQAFLSPSLLASV